jgi:hypothetical protein
MAIAQLIFPPIEVEQTIFPLKKNVVVKIEGVEYSKVTGGVPESIAILFIAKNVLRYELFEEIENLNDYVRKYRETKDFEPIDIDDSNDTDIFVYGLYDKIPIKTAVEILTNYCDADIKTPYSKAIIQQYLKSLNANVFGKFKQLAMEWLGNGVIKAK